MIIDLAAIPIGIVIGMILGNGNFASFSVGLLSGWVMANPETNMDYMKEKYNDFINNNK
jgi:hypothetical protein